MEISQIFEHIINNQTNLIALIVISVLTVLALFGSFKSRKTKFGHFAKQAPAILATVGIFFSFWGISIGLIGLDLNEIQDSIPKLLEGLKAKFLASLMGIFASIIVRIAQSFTLEQEIEEQHLDEEIVSKLDAIHTVLATNAKNSPEELLLELKNAIAELPNEFKIQSKLLDSIKSSLAGEGDGSVTTQLTKVRMDVRDTLTAMAKSNEMRSDELNKTLNSNFDKLIKQFDEFARVAAENNSKAFIEALEKAMRDFNKNITEQFGENFKQLNHAVGELLKWQDNYKAHVEALTGNFEVALNGLTSIQTAFGDIHTRSQSFSEISRELGVILEKLDLQLHNLDQYLVSLSQVADSAKQAFPTIEDNLTKLTTGFKKSAEKSLSDINNTVESVGENLVETTNRLKETSGKLRDSMENQRDTLETTSDEFKKTVSATLKTLAEETKNGITEFEKSITESGNSLKNTTENMGNHVIGVTTSMKEIMEDQKQALLSTSADFKTVTGKTLDDLARETQESIKRYQITLQEVVTQQLDSIDENIEASNQTINTTIKKASVEFEKSITESGNTLKATTERVGNHVIDATTSMKEIMEDQKQALLSTSAEFKTVTGKTLDDLARETQESIKTYQITLQEAVTQQLGSIDISIKKSNEIINTTIQNASTEFESTIKKQASVMTEAILAAGNSFHDVIKNTGKEFEKMTGVLAESIHDNGKTLESTGQAIRLNIESMLRELTNQSKASIKEYETSLHNIVMSQFNIVKDSVAVASRDFNKLLAENTEKSTNVLVQQTQLLDAALQEELKKAIETMGKHLAALSNQFVQDYRPLTDKLREVVLMAEELKRGR